MRKFCGKIGYSSTSETKPGVYTETIIEKDVIGESDRIAIKNQNDSKVNQNIVANDQISIVADPELTQNYHLIKYVKYWGVAWSVTSVRVEYPRLFLTLGGVYNVK